MLRDILAYFSGEIDLMTMLIEICVIVFVIFCCMPVHECAHAWMADRLGDPTGRLSGRISFNPFDHMSLPGTLMILVFGFGYAKPVPVNINNFKNKKLHFGLTALAGPVSNMLLAIIFTAFSVIFMFFIDENSSIVFEIAYIFFYYVAYYNVALAVFNFIPLPPLDGSRILGIILPDRIYYNMLQYERYLFYALFALLFIFNRIGFSPLSIVTTAVFEVIFNIFATVFGFIF